jgi:uncharacterized membrane protein YccC
MASASPQISTEPPQAVTPIRSDALRRFWKTLTRFDATKAVPSRALRNAIGVVIPLIVGYAFGMPRGGLVIASGALNVSYSDGSDPYRTRAKRMVASSLLCSVAVFAGAISGERQVAAVLLATAWAFVVGMFWALDGAAADLGSMSLVILLIYAAQPLTPKQAAQAGVLTLAGGLLQTALSVALWPVHRFDPERRALADFYFELSRRALTPLNPTSPPLATTQSEQAQNALSSMASQSDADSFRYRALLDQGERMRLSLLMLLRLQLRMERENRNYSGIKILSDYLQTTSQILNNIAEALAAREPSSKLEDQGNPTEIKPDDLKSLAQLEEHSARLRGQTIEVSASFLAAVAKDAVFQMEALSGQLRAGLDLVRDSGELTNEQNAATPVARHHWKQVFGGRIETLRANLNLQSSAYRHALRLAAMVAIGDVLGRSISWRRTYWLPMTIVLVLKPEFASTFSRGLLRIVGTIAGLLLATGLFHFVHPGAEMQIFLVFVFAFLLRWIGPANYGVFGVAVSALIVLMLAFVGISPAEVIWARGLTTAAGGALALVAYAAWPTWERTLVSDQIARLLDAYRDYVGVLPSARPSHELGSQELERVRRAARSARTNLQASADRLASEPGTTREQLAGLNAILASSHRLIHAIMALDLIFLQNPGLADSEPFRRYCGQLSRTLTLLSAALHGERVMAREFPDLREEHRLLMQARTPPQNAAPAQFEPVNVEADRITNSVNTLAEHVMHWVRSPQFAKLRRLRLTAQPHRA